MKSHDLWFVAIHPFDDGNGRIARTIPDMALARSGENPHRFYSMSAQIWTFPPSRSIVDIKPPSALARWLRVNGKIRP
jgi:Fic/DOC family